MICLLRCPPRIVAAPWLLQQRRVLSLWELFYIHFLVFGKSLRYQVPAVHEPQAANSLGRQQAAPHPAPAGQSQRPRRPSTHHSGVAQRAVGLFAVSHDRAAFPPQPVAGGWLQGTVSCVAAPLEGLGSRSTNSGTPSGRGRLLRRQLLSRPVGRDERSGGTNGIH